jgi:exopolyphosphatase/guanosine-5'-triphosphate,3'-diphosphate pyrophosphatase
MAKRTAVIDIGSNSARLVIFQKTSRYGFYLLAQHKSRVRIGEGAYQRGGLLQYEPMERAFETLRSFAQILDAYRVKKILCVATSALRDAPNRSVFLSRVKEELGLVIRVIDGEQEARYGAIAAKNLLPIHDAISIDIGGGSADMALICNGKILETFSLNLGTVRLKELFTDQTISIKEARAYIHQELSRLPESFRSSMAIGIGGSARALAKGVMAKSDYPFDKLHAFAYVLKEQHAYLEEIVHASIRQLDGHAIQAERYDTIREGVLIFQMILEHIGAEKIMTSGVGVREGVYLHALLKRDGDRFPADVNPSIQSIRDRLDLLEFPSGYKRKMGRELFDLFQDKFDGTDEEKRVLLASLELSNIGKILTIYKEHQHAFYVAKHELNFGFTHEQMLLIAMILRSKGKKYHKELFRTYASLLPGKKRLKWLIFIYSIVLILDENAPRTRITFRRENNTLKIDGDFAGHLIREAIEKLPLMGKTEIKV